MKSNEKNKFDILIPCHVKDKEIIKECIKYIKKNILGYRKIFVLSKGNFLPEYNNIKFVDESIFPFSIKDFAKYAPKGRAGWYYTQFLRLYFFKIMGKEVLDNVLTIDADTSFIKKTAFFKEGIPLYNVEIGHHQPYYDILEKVFGFGKEHPKYSGTTHNMLFQREYIEEIFSLNSKRNKNDLWLEIMKNIDINTESGFSCYDLYFNYMLKFHPKKIKIRKLIFIDFPSNNPVFIKFFEMLGYNYLSCHEYYTRERFPAIRSFARALLTRIGIKEYLKSILLRLKIFKRK